MDIIVEFILNMFVDTTFDLVENDKANRIIRFIAGSFLVFIYLCVLEIIISFAITEYKSSVLLSMILMGIFILLIVSTIKSLLKVLKKIHTKK